MSERTYIAIDLKSFYASVECAERHLDPLTTNLVVADATRTEKTICLAVSPSLKAHGISGRARLFEVVQKVKELNAVRLSKAPGKHFSSSSFDANIISKDPSVELSYITAPPQMRKYMEYSSRIYNIYLKYISADDIHVYSIDEVFIDATNYLSFYNLSARELAMTMIREVLYTTGITATGGIGTNLYLCKIAMDIVAKHVPPDKDGVRIAELDEHSYRKLLWTHEPLTDFWRVGHGTARRLARYQIFTMGDIARCSIGKKTDFYNEDLLYQLFGVNAELLIDHAWGWEPVTMDLIKSYEPESSSLSSGQVLSEPYTFEKAEIIVREMLELLILDMVSKHLTTDQIVLSIGYDNSNLTDPKRVAKYNGPIAIDYYGRLVPRHAHGSVNLGSHTSSTELIIKKTMRLYRLITDPNLLIRRVSMAAANILSERSAAERNKYQQLSLFDSFDETIEEKRAKEEKDRQEKSLQRAMLKIQKKYGKNAILKGTSLQEGATTQERNNQIGGHRA